MTHTPPSTNPGPNRRKRRYYVLAALAVVIVLYFIFFPAEEAETPTVDGNDNAVVEGSPTTGAEDAPPATD